MVVILVRRPDVTGSPAPLLGFNKPLEALHAQTIALINPSVQFRPERRRDCACRDVVLRVMVASISPTAAAARGLPRRAVRLHGNTVRPSLERFFFNDTATTENRSGSPNCELMRSYSARTDRPQILDCTPAP